MQAKEIESRVEKMVMPIIEENAFELVDVEYLKEGPQYYLRIYVDKEGGFTIDDCELVSRFIEKKLEADDFIESAYILEVSSPGIDRILRKDKEFTKYKGKDVYIKLFKADENGIKEFTGELLGLIDNNIVIKTENDNEVAFDRKSVAVCRLSVVF